MAQKVFSNINPDVTTGLMLAGILDDFKDALMSGLSGATRPTQIKSGGIWVDTSQESPPDYRWTVKLYNGSTDIDIFSVDIVTGSSGFSQAEESFTVRKISEDATGATFNFAKSRIEDSGQVKDGDDIAGINIWGHANLTDLLSAAITAVAQDDFTSGSHGALLKISHTIKGTSNTVDSLGFLERGMTSYAPHILSKISYNHESVAGTSSMLLTTDCVVTSVTGSSGQTISGVEYDDEMSHVKIIVNAGTVPLTLSHSNADANSVLSPTGSDLTIPVNGTVTLYYVDTRWRVIAASNSREESLVNIGTGTSSWISPVTTAIRVVSVSDGTNSINSNVLTIDVSSGSTYLVTCGAGPCYFGDNYIGQDLDGATIYYLV